MFDKIKNGLKKFWKWILSVVGIGAVAVALTVPNGAAPVVPCRDDATKKIENRITVCPVAVSERASFKGQEIAKQVSAVTRTNVKFSGADYDIQIVETKAIPGGIEVLARAWKDGEQIGFGDGTIDIEKFRIKNPPVLVGDPNGEIIREWIDSETGETKQRKLREAPQEALLHTLAHTIKVIPKKLDSKNIIQGKRGSTHTTYFPAAGSNSPVDGTAFQNIDEGSGVAWATIHDNTVANLVRDDTAVGESYADVRADTTTNKWRTIARSFFLFDTSDIDDGDDITAATLSLFGSAKTTTLATSINIYSSAPGANNTIATGDYDSLGTTAFSTKITVGNFNTAAYNDFALNATGLADISKTGISKFGTRDAEFDAPNTEPTWASGVYGSCRGYMADQTGTDNDPKLVVTHATTTAEVIKQDVIFFD
jgi:hypothetical protein